MSHNLPFSLQAHYGLVHTEKLKVKNSFLVPDSINKLVYPEILLKWGKKTTSKCTKAIQYLYTKKDPSKASAALTLLFSYATILK